MFVVLRMPVPLVLENEIEFLSVICRSPVCFIVSSYREYGAVNSSVAQRYAMISRDQVKWRSVDW